MEDTQAKASNTYNAAADHYDDEANSFWDRFGRRTVERLHLRPGFRVLDVCCGSGASAIPAAEVVGPDGSVVGVDLADNLLQLARNKADQRGLSNINFRRADMLNLEFPSSTFDAVVCVFGIFFVPDMECALRKLWELIKPRGKLAITTWGPNFFEPASAAFWDSVRAVRPDLYKGFNPWDRITQPDQLRELLAAAGIDRASVHAEPGVQAVDLPEHWWSMVMGTGYRGTVEQLTANEREQVHQQNLKFIQEHRIDSVEANVVYAIAIRE